MVSIKETNQEDVLESNPDAEKEDLGNEKGGGEENDGGENE